MLKQNVLAMREELLNKWFFKIKFVSIFLYLLIAAFLLAFIVSFIYTMNYNYNLKLLNAKLGYDFMISAIVCGCAFLVFLFFGIYLHTYSALTIYLMHKFNAYAPKNNFKKINKLTFRISFYFYTKTKNKSNLKYNQANLVYEYITNYNEYKQGKRLIYAK